MIADRVTIYHNPRCTKSRETLQLLRDKGVEPEVVEYLNTPPDEATLGRLVTMLGIEPADLLRRKSRSTRNSGWRGSSTTERR